MRPALLRSLASALVLALPLALAQPLAAQEDLYSPLDRVHPVLGSQGMVATQEALATQAGLGVLQNGGNAVDAAATVAFVLAVTLPSAGNLGGGGFMMVYDADSGETVAIDYREMAGAAAFRDMYLDADGNADPQKSRFSGLAVGVPGTVAGMALALEQYGTISLAEALQPAIALAESGMEVTPDLARSLSGSIERLQQWPSSTRVFYKDGGVPYEAGEVLVQPDLANSMKLIAADGPGRLLWRADRREDRGRGRARRRPSRRSTIFKSYQAVLREPVRGTYRGYEIASMPPPSSGGVHIIQILNTLEGVPIGELGHNSAATIHQMAEAMKYAYADRSEYLGDPDFVDVPVAALTSKDYAKAIRAKITDRAAAAEDIKPGDLAPYESPDTTHFSVVDKDGNAVANTYTLNFGYGTGLVADGTGILLNNELDDFSAKPGVPNAYGLIGGDANAVEARKRPLSSMSPTLVLKDGKPFLVTGSPGGARIITTTLQIIMNVIDHGMNVAEATLAPRIHHQWLPDELRIEEGISPDTIALLEAKGYTVATKNTMGSTQSIMVTEDGLFGFSDPRTPGGLTLGY